MPKRCEVVDVPSADRIISATIRAAQQRQGHQAEAVSVPQTLEEFFDDLRNDEEEAILIKMETVNRFIDFIFQDGPHPAMAMRNMFAIVHAIRPEALLNMSSKEIGLLLDRTKAAHCWRVEQIISRILKKSGAKGYRTRFQKSESSRANYSKAQMGNHNRTKSTKRRTAA